MKIFTVVAALKYLSAILAVAFLFVDWKIAFALFLVGMILHVIPKGPHMLFKTLVGVLIIGGIVYVFVDWRIGIAFFIAAYLVAQFYGWGNKKNMEYYAQRNSLNNMANPEESRKTVHTDPGRTTT